MATREEELQELAELEELAQLEAMAAQEQGEEEAPIEQEAENYTADHAKAVGLGVMESIPFAKDVAAGAEALYDEATEADEFSLSQMGDKYRKNKREWDDEINEAEEKYPATFTTADIATGVGLGIATGGTSLAANIGLGAAEGLSRSEDRDVWDAVAGGAIAGAMDRAMFGTGKALKFMGKKLGVIASRGIGEGVGAVNKSKARELNQHVRKMYLSGDKTRTLTEGYDQFAKDMLEETTESGKPFLGVFQTLEETQVEAAKNLQRYGKEMGKVLAETDEVVKNVDTKRLRSRMQREIVEPLAQNAHPKAKKIAAQFSKEIDDIFLDVEPQVTKKLKVGAEGLLEEITEEGPPKITYKDIRLKDLHDMKVYLAREAGNAFDKEGREVTQGALELRKQVGITSDFIDEIIDDAGIDIPSANSYKKLKKKWANMLVVERMSADEAASRSMGPFGKMKSLLSLRGFFITSTVGGMGGGPTGLLVSAALNEAMTSSRTPMAMAKGINSLSKHLQNAPDSKYAKRIAVAAGLSADTLREAVTSSIAELNLSASPVQRNSQDALSKRSSIINALEPIDKDLARQLDEAFQDEDEETISTLMDNISKDPSTKGLIEPGIGWDGKWHSEEDRVQLEHSIRVKNLPASQESAYLDDLLQGNVPEVVPQQPYQRQYASRDKSKHSY